MPFLSFFPRITRFLKSFRIQFFFKLGNDHAAIPALQQQKHFPTVFLHIKENKINVKSALLWRIKIKELVVVENMWGIRLKLHISLKIKYLRHNNKKLHTFYPRSSDIFWYHFWIYHMNISCLRGTILVRNHIFRIQHCRWRSLSAELQNITLIFVL